MPVLKKAGSKIVFLYFQRSSHKECLVLAGRLPTNQPTNQPTKQTAFSIPAASLGGIATLAITIICSGQNRCGTARRGVAEGGRDGPAAQLTTSGLFRFRSCLGTQAYNLPPFRRVDIPNFHLDFAGDTSPAFKMNMALCPKQHLATYDNDKGPEWKYVSE